jgi:serine/threonine protein kinase
MTNAISPLNRQSIITVHSVSTGRFSTIREIANRIFLWFSNLIFSKTDLSHRITVIQSAFTKLAKGKVKQIWSKVGDVTHAYLTPRGGIFESRKAKELREETETALTIKAKLGPDRIKHLAVDMEVLPKEEWVNGKYTLKTARANGDLEKAIRDPKHPLTPSILIDICGQVLDGMTALHEAGYYHGDMKLENVLYAKNPDGTITAKISDFGKTGDASGPLKRNTGNTRFAAPELKASQESDVWATGMMIVRILEQHLLESKKVDALLKPRRSGLFKPHEIRSGIEAFLVENKNSPAAETRGLQAVTGQLTKLIKTLSDPKSRKEPTVMLDAEVAKYIDILIESLIASPGFVKKPHDKTTLHQLGVLLSDMMTVFPKSRPKMAQAQVRFEALKIDLETPKPIEKTTSLPIMEAIKEEPAPIRTIRSASMPNIKIADLTEEDFALDTLFADVEPTPPKPTPGLFERITGLYSSAMTAILAFSHNLDLDAL